MDKILALLAERDVSCTLRKQPKYLTDFFYARLKEYSLLIAHPQAAEDPRRMLIARLWTFLRMIGKPNDVWRKNEMIKSEWPALEQDLTQVL